MLVTAQRLGDAVAAAVTSTTRTAALAAGLEAARQRARASVGLLAAAIARRDYAAMADAAEQAQMDLGHISGFARLLARE